ncbi:hypothetical protein [Deinococcus roseus]|uniref:Uncharacterized protein n=1 Tax=Deinococcus roseus TaxID=392414 RepID=A0ABQ2CWW6_9DEIO|nr:hypothetical protein [Deinococcus roseus]GGJ28713.1 hypothetical protein GCM10008938_13500 [Deinococcus roseus]
MDWLILSVIMLIVIISIYLLYRITNPPELQRRPSVHQLRQERSQTKK